MCVRNPLLFLLAVCLLPLATLARPISYPGGLTLDVENDRSTHSVLFHYSPTFRWSVGYRAEQHSKWALHDSAGWLFQGAQINFLVRRFNTRRSQMNIYFKNALGVVAEDRQHTSTAAFSELAWDAETRRLFGSAYTRHYLLENEQFAVHGVRVGIAPYIAGYGSLHTWFMLQASKHEALNNEWTTMALVRLFSGTYLVEVGVGEQDSYLANLLVRF